MAWYNKYRPSNFTQASGQTLVKKVLQNSVKTVFSPNPKVKHAYLLSGPRGTGKTSLARIFSRSVNCLDRVLVEKDGEACGVCDVCKNGQIDIIELDAASNTGIDNIRDLIEAANTPPFISRYKIYIIDEVHMLSKAAMNALLKTLEEPPLYIVFLMATTDPDKILGTILSRVTHLKLVNHTLEDISNLLIKISKLENLVIETEAINLISKISKGGLRDAINLLETVSNYNLEHYGESEVAEILGVLPSTRLENLAKNLTFETFKELKEAINEFETLGSDPETLLSQLLDYLLSFTLENYLKTEILNQQYNDLIKVLADILSNHLALGSIQSALTLVKIRLESPLRPSQTQASKAVHTKDFEGKKHTVEFEEKQNEPAPIIKKITQIDNILTLEKPAESIQPNPLKSNDQSFDGVRVSDFGSLIESNLSDPDFPMMLKTFWQNIQAFEDENTLYLYLPNKTFILPLKSSKVTQWMKNLTAKNHSQTKSIVVVTDDDSTFEKIKDLLTPKKNHSIKEELEQIDKTPIIPFQPKEIKLEVKTAVDTDTDKQVFQVSDFYYLYAALPDGTIPAGMKLLSKQPILSADNSKIEHWGNELEDLDLE